MALLQHKSSFLLITTLSFVSGSMDFLLQHGSLGQASDALTQSGHISMSITLEQMYPGPDSQKITIFAPPDSAIDMVEPLWDQLLLHFSPVYLSPLSLASLAFSSTLPSLSDKKRLTVTTSQEDNKMKLISINNVRISPSPIYDDGASVVVYAIGNLFDPDFTLA